MADLLCTCFLVMAWDEPCPRHTSLTRGNLANERALPPPPTLEDIFATVAKLDAFGPSGPAIAGYLVAPDLWERFAAAVPVVRGSSASMGTFTVRREPALPPGTCMPIDREGKPIPKPKEGR